MRFHPAHDKELETGCICPIGVNGLHILGETCTLLGQQRGTGVAEGCYTLGRVSGSFNVKSRFDSGMGHFPKGCCHHKG